MGFRSIMICAGSSWFRLGFRCLSHLFPPLSLLRTGVLFHHCLLVRIGSSWGFGACLPSSLLVLSSGQGFCSIMICWFLLVLAGVPVLVSHILSSLVRVLVSLLLSFSFLRERVLSFFFPSGQGCIFVCRNPSWNQDEPTNHDGTQPLSGGKQEEGTRETSTGTPARTTRNQPSIMERNPLPEVRKKRENKGDKHRNWNLSRNEDPPNHEGTKAVCSKDWGPHSAQECLGKNRIWFLQHQNHNFALTTLPFSYKCRTVKGPPDRLCTICIYNVHTSKHTY